MRAREQLLPLTGIRFVLALWVVLFHQRFALITTNNTLHGLLHSGYVAVGFFFVLSGFVLAYNYSLAAPWSKKEVQGFAVARFARIYPAYVAGLVLMLPFVLFGSDGLLRDLTHGPTVIRNLALNVALVQAWIPNAALSLNSPGWSLCCEAFFYAMFPLVGVSLWKLTQPRHLIIAGLIAWLIALAAPILLVTYGAASGAPRTATDPGLWINFVKFNPLLRLPEFCVGIVTARIFQLSQRADYRWRDRGYLFYLPAMVLTVIVLSHSTIIPDPILHNGLLLPLYALVILGLALDGGLVAKALSSRGMVYLGNASYALYILHYPLVLGSVAIGKRVMGREPSGIAWVLFVTTTAVSVSCVMFSFFEEYMNRTIRAKLQAASNGLEQSLPADEFVALERS